MTAALEILVDAAAAVTTLGAPMGATDTTVTLATTPTTTAGQFRLAVDTGSAYELVLLASPPTGNVYQVQGGLAGRGIEGTTAQAHVLGVVARAVLSSDGLQRFTGRPAASVVNPAAVAALAPSAAWPSGTLVFSAANGGQTFALITSSARTVDGTTVLTATASAGGGQWVDTKILPQLTTLVAPSIVTGLISGNASAGTPATAVVTWGSSPITVGATNLVLTIPQSATPILILSGTLTASITITVPSAVAPFWVVAAGVTFAGHAITFQYSTASTTFALTTPVAAQLFGDGASNLYGFLGSGTSVPQGLLSFLPWERTPTPWTRPRLDDLTNFPFSTVSAPATPVTLLGASLVAWWRPDLGFASSTWADQSGNGHTATQANGSQQFTLGASGPNGTATVAGSNASNTFMLASFAVSKPMWIWIVCRWTSASTNQYMLDGPTFGQSYFLKVGTTSVAIDSGASIGATVAPNTFQAWGLTYGTSGSICSNAVSLITGSTGTTASTGLTIGAAGNQSASADCLISDIVIASTPPAANVMLPYSVPRYGF